MLVLRQVHARYRHVPVLRGLSLEVTPGSAVGLIGRNGAGKTTILRCILNLVPERRGEIQFDGHDLMRLPAHAIPRLGIGYVPQDRGAFERLTVGENLQLVPIPRVEARQRMERALDEFPLLRRRWAQRAGTLSGGEMKLLGLARARLLEPKLVLLDEPTANLDRAAVEGLRQALARWRDAGVSLLVVEHNFDFLLEDLCDRICVLQRGETVFDGSANDLRADGKARLRQFFGLGGEVGDDSAISPPEGGIYHAAPI